MNNDPELASGPVRSPVPRRLTALAASLACACWGLGAAAQESPPTIGGFPPLLPPVGARPNQQPAALAPFIESLASNESSFEVKLNQGRLLTLKEDLAQAGRPAPLIAVGDPGVIDFTVVGPRQIRITGLRIGTTDLSITSATGRTYSFEVQVVADLDVLRAQLKQLYPDAVLRLAMIRDHLVVEGQARDASQVGKVISTIRAYLTSVQNAQLGSSTSSRGAPLAAGVPNAMGAAQPPPAPAPDQPGAAPAGPQVGPGGVILPGASGQVSTSTTVTPPQIINLIHVPTSQQVLLKVRVAELNRTGFRQIGANVLGIDSEHGTIFGTNIGPSGVSAASAISPVSNPVVTASNPVSSLAARNLVGAATNTITTATTAFGIFQKNNFDILFGALRRNNLLKILAEPNLVAMNGHQASFLAGGEFPIAVPQAGGIGGLGSVTVQFKPFGVRLDFLPVILDGDRIRLTVDPEVSQVDFSIAVTTVAGGSPVPGLNTRKSHTTVELQEGQTLAIAGLMQLTLDGSTSRIPGLGDLPVIGPFFSNTTSQRQEKELVVLVTPYLIEPMNANQVPPGPGDEVRQPNDLEFYFMNRIEGRTGVDARATTLYDDPFHIVRHGLLERKYLAGPCGYSK